MLIPCNNFVVPIFEEDLCGGERKSAACVIDSSIYSELSLSANATQQQINQAIYLAYLNLKAVTENTDATVSGLDGSETKIEAGDNVEITGSGTTVNPYIVGTTDSRPYKVYSALISQTGTSAPTAIVLENTIGTITWTYTDVGIYNAVSANLYTENKTFTLTSQEGIQQTATSSIWANTNQVAVVVQKMDTGVFMNGRLNQTSIEIRVYN